MVMIRPGIFFSWWFIYEGNSWGNEPCFISFWQNRLRGRIPSDNKWLEVDRHSTGIKISRFSLMFLSCLLQVGNWQEIISKRILRNNFCFLNFSPSREPRSMNIFLHLRIFSTLRNFFFAHYGNLPYGSHCYMYLFLLQYELIRSCGEVFGNFVNDKIIFAGKD